VLSATYGIGNGPNGNVGADTITCIVFRGVVSGFGAMTPRNPQSARGGMAPEAPADVRMFAPHAFRTTLERAITAEDYATLTADDARRRAGRASSIVPFRRLQGAKAALRWTGSWYEAAIALDPLGQSEADAALLTEIEIYLDRYRRVGHDLRVESGRYVPLDLALCVCVASDVVRGQVAARLRQVLGSRVTPDGSLGLFHPDNLGFGTDLSVSRIVAAVQGVPGVTSVSIMRLRRYRVGDPAMRPDDPAEPLPAGGILAFSAFEIPRLDDDPSLPENGRVTLHMRGGR
jgi:predicted phage baseplate assembly protein